MLTLNQVYLNSLTGGDRDQLWPILTEYLEAVDTAYSKLKEALSRDPTEAKEPAEVLKSVSANAGADRVAKACLAVERAVDRAVETKRETDFDKLMVWLESEIKESKVAIQETVLPIAAPP